MEARMCFEFYNMGYRILVFYPERLQGIKFANILPTHVKTQNTFWLPLIILILICLTVQIRYYTLMRKDSNLYLRLQTMLYTIYAAKFEQTITYQHVLLRRESQSY